MTTYSVRRATCDITPNGPTTLAASGSDELSSRVDEPLEANFVQIDHAQSRVLFISVDLLYPGRVVREIAERTFEHLSPDEIVLAASHTHRAPMTDDTKPGLGHPDAEYLSLLERRFRDVANSMKSQRGQTCYLKAHTGRAHHSINRRLKKRIVIARRPKWQSYVNAPNRNAPTDETLTSLTGRSVDGTLQFVIWNYACHPVGYPDRHAISGHYPHRVAQALRATNETPDTTVVFMQGFSGNTRPVATATLKRWKRRARRLVVGPIFDDMDYMSYRDWTNSLAETMISSISDTAGAPCSDRIRTARLSSPGELYVRGAKEPVTVQAISIGDAFGAVLISAEVVCEYAPVVRSITRTATTALVGCVDHTIGYLPTRQIQLEGGYEAGGYCRSFGLDAVHPDVETNLRSLIRETWDHVRIGPAGS